MSSEEQSERDLNSGAIAWMARNPVAANLLMVILIAGGVFTAFNIQKEVNPNFQLDIVQVQVGYPGAAPTEVEQGIILPIEETIRSVDGIKEFTSQAREGSGSVSIELVQGTNRMQAFQDIDQAINRIRTFPNDIDQPRVSLQSNLRGVLDIVLYGNTDQWSLRKLAEQLRDRMLSDPRITQIELQNSNDYVTHVEIPRATLRAYRITLQEVADVISQSSEDVAAGTVETETGEILLRLSGRKQWAEEFGEIEILRSESGTSVKLSDLATVTDGFEEGSFPSQFNQTPSTQVEIYRIGDQSPLEISEAVNEIMANFESTLPPGVNWRIDSNAADDYRQRLSLLIKNGAIAIFIVLAILSLFLEFRLAIWVMAGMAISFIGGILFLPLVDVSINMVSMFAFLVVLGIVVDDAIVVGENIHEQRQQGMNFLDAAIHGAKDISGPVIFSILTNIVAFVPLLFIPGETGLFWWPLPAVVIIVLAVSLFEALYILPAHLAHAKEGSRTKIGSKLHNLQQRFARKFDGFVNNYYRRFLELCLKARYITIIAAVGLFIIVGSYATSSHMGMINMPEVSADEIEAGIRLPVGVTPDQAWQVAQDVTASTLRMFDEHNLHEVAEGVKTNIRGGSFVDVEIVMRPPDEHDRTAREVIDLWRQEIGDIPGVDQVTFEAESGPGGYRQDISVDLSHNDIAALEQATAAFVERAESFDNTRDASDNYNKGKRQIDFTLRTEGRALGLTQDDLGEQIRASFYGALATRQLRGTNEFEVRVKLPLPERKNIHNLEDLVIQTPDGTEVPLLDVADVSYSEAFSSINRRDGRRVVTVSMDVEPKRTLGQVINAFENEVLPEIRSEFPGLTWTFEGSQAEMRESTGALYGGLGLALFVIYALLAVAFGSYVQPLIVLVAIPFGAIGAAIGHIILGYDLSLISLMGMIALSGVVVNDSLIMIDYANRQRKNVSPFEAIHRAGLRRFRPIALTTMTTACGLIPIITETSMQAQYLIPMAISLGFGIVFATSIILILVPCLYLMFEDGKVWLGKT
ncbi:efflux RND transporter permease subunit [Pelagicoccus sp. SDUM812002]|uniref:efflux RND transporter permease subunit n=1 Tax=Pelagicoccus sp. SDUM812002 TaxID=3041266 RepID=UPI00280D1A7A|nr:efflux RND transporter permease subunit [Pelagicoccus sp. SDUM812002]MDQ8184642.1 efflux RND transporter permease subunit [Pelagicoccus sp. SDUM812002]